MLDQPNSTVQPSLVYRLVTSERGSEHNFERVFKMYQENEVNPY